MSIIASLGERQRALSDIRELQFQHSARVVNGVVPRWESQELSQRAFSVVDYGPPEFDPDEPDPRDFK
jgi:hypothetical protein